MVGSFQHYEKAFVEMLIFQYLYMIRFFSFLLNSTAGLFKKWNGSYAFKLLCRIKRTNKDNAPNSFLDAAMQEKMYHDGYEATLYKLGNGPKKILLLHGWKGYSERWSPLVNIMDLDQFTIHALDAPAHGRSAGNSLNLEIYRQFVAQTIAGAGAMHAIVAHSLGGLVTAYAFLSDKNLPVDRFIITGAPAGMQAIYDFFKRMMALKTLVIDNMDDHISSNITTIPALEINMDSFFKNVRKPVLVIHDEDDKICLIEPIKKGMQTSDSIDNLFTKGLGHDLQAMGVYTRTLEFLEADFENK